MTLNESDGGDRPAPWTELASVFIAMTVLSAIVLPVFALQTGDPILSTLAFAPVNGAITTAVYAVTGWGRWRGEGWS